MVTINQFVRKNARLPEEKLKPVDVTYYVELSLSTINIIAEHAGAPKWSIDDFENANAFIGSTKSLIGDQLIGYHALWQLHEQNYNATVTDTDHRTEVRHVADRWRQNFLTMLMTLFPGMVDLVDGQLVLKTRPNAFVDLIVQDSRDD